MPPVGPEITQWTRQMNDGDQVIAYFAYQSLLEAVLHSSAPDQAALQADLANALGSALVAQSTQGTRAAAASESGNPFLAAAARQTVRYQHPPRVRVNLARLLGYIPHEAAVPYLAQALGDADAREMARCSLELNPSERAAEALISALDAAGATFRVGVLNSLSKRKGLPVIAALRRAAEDSQPEVRLAALLALADFPDPSLDALLEKLPVARARLAETLRASGNQPAAERIYKSILASDADAPQKKAARLALGTGAGG
jgi:HEAT repeat protein